MDSQYQNVLAQAIKYHQTGKIQLAADLYEKILEKYPSDFDTLHMYGMLQVGMQRPLEGLPMLQRALEINPSSARLHNNLALALENTGQIDQALYHSTQATDLEPEYADAHSNKALLLKVMGRNSEALSAIKKAIKLEPRNPEILNNLGIILQEIQDWDAAWQAHNDAIEIRPKYAEAYNNRGNASRGAGQYNSALNDYNRALTLNPKIAQIHNNIGVLNAIWKKHQVARSHYEKAIQINPFYADPVFNISLTFMETGNYEDALRYLNQLFNAIPEYPYVLGYLVQAKMQICDWQNIESLIAELVNRVEEEKLVCTPLTSLAISDNPQLQKQVAQSWVKNKLAAQPERSVPILRNTNYRKEGGKLRIGYFSPDFRNHPVAFLIAGLIEQHDRKNFECIGFYYGQPTTDDLHNRLKQSFDQFVLTAERTDQEIAMISRSLEVDIAVDLAGHTLDGRPGIFLNRAAPVQVNYLGFPGTSAIDTMDYIISDENLIPAETAFAYSESLLKLPFFQCNDPLRYYPRLAPARSNFGIAEDAFVFCNFSNTYKLTPMLFASWARLLRELSGSVLLLLAEHSVTENNLKKYAEAYQIDPNRLIFVPRVTREIYLDRFLLGDLYLDTFPFNGGTTASDAFWVGIPFLTLEGRAYASRMGSSLVRSSRECNAMVASTLAEYEDLALNYSKFAKPKAWHAMRFHPMSSVTESIFDIAKFTTNLESAFRYICKKEIN